MSLLILGPLVMFSMRRVFRRGINLLLLYFCCHVPFSLVAVLSCLMGDNPGPNEALGFMSNRLAASLLRSSYQRRRLCFQAAPASP